MRHQKTQRVQKARAIVINEKSAGESNKQLTLLAKDEGKLTVFAKGARNQKSKFFAGSQPFCYCDFVLFNGGDFLSVTQTELIRNFSSYYNDVYKFMYGSFLLELADKTVMFSQEANDIMLLLLEALHKMEKAESPKKISAAFQIKLFDLLGICPDADICSLCGNRSENNLYYSINEISEHGGFVCSNCRSGASVKAADGTLKAISYFKNAKSASEVFSFSVTESVLEDIYCIAGLIAESHLETNLRTPGIIKNL